MNGSRNCQRDRPRSHGGVALTDGRMVQTSRAFHQLCHPGAPEGSQGMKLSDLKPAV
ncbi:hypothetical protein SEA_JOIEB_71 [Mycobacterium phage JoieB]|uniref:Uncharacterized protein n=2 Tax=Marvinvirus marvin TaxID=1982092 RepID=A0A3G8FHN5_9CAUD|nr:hypothetical protein SEA_BEELZEBUB_74 [Mycobacterium phage Beelzebub]QFP94208.1 hypothetical protein SEA_JOIEB_71 [Mycobacterium phage JoieB]